MCSRLVEYNDESATRYTHTSSYFGSRTTALSSAPDNYRIAQRMSMFAAYASGRFALSTLAHRSRYSAVRLHSCSSIFPALSRHIFSRHCLLCLKSRLASLAAASATVKFNQFCHKRIRLFKPTPHKSVL